MKLAQENMGKINYCTTDRFVKDFKKLSKIYESLEDDLTIVKRNAIELFHIHNINNQSCFPIPSFCTENMKICKIKKFACRSMKGKGVKSGIRIIYAFIPKQEKVIFIEIYYKGNKANEDRERIKEFIKNNN